MKSKRLQNRHLRHLPSNYRITWSFLSNYVACGHSSNCSEPFGGTSVETISCGQLYCEVRISCAAVGGGSERPGGSESTLFATVGGRTIIIVLSSSYWLLISSTARVILLI